jgi:hypothetical protein
MSAGNRSFISHTTKIVNDNGSPTKELLDYFNVKDNSDIKTFSDSGFLMPVLSSDQQTKTSNNQIHYNKMIIDKDTSKVKINVNGVWKSIAFE